MNIDAAVETPLGAEQLFGVIADLATYPRWMGIVGRAERAPADGADPGPAWWVDLRGQLGPLRRSKRLRMCRVLCEGPSTVRFERHELDHKSHSPWVLEAAITTTPAAARAGDPGPAGTRLEMRLHYGGTLWVPILDRILADEIERSKPRLLAEALRQGPPTPE